MEILQTILQVVAGLGLFNVWLLRFNRNTAYRGGNAADMRAEFAYYGLPEWSVFAIGFLKLASAVGLLLGLFLPVLVLPSALLLAILMVGALAMHVKVKDPIMRSIPAISMLVIALLVALLAA